LVQTLNHASTTPLSFFTGWMPFLPPNQQRQFYIKVNNSPSDAACSKQLPSPVVANGNNRWQMPISAHQFSRPTVQQTSQQKLAGPMYIDLQLVPSF